jgi:hypothetical protein
MKTDTFNPEELIGDSIPLLGLIDIKVFRADGSVENKTLKNVVTRAGLNRIANRAVLATTTSVVFVIGVGTQTAVHSLDSAQGGVGEMLRKTSNFVNGAAQSREWIFLQCTIGGASDSMTGFLLDSVFMSDGVNSSSAVGIIAGVTNGLGVTLAGSDLLDVTYRFRVGSHNLSHST